jgi:pyruvate dehydrogenase E2 component (dihydrolipoamide acetyltransferase)
MEAGTIAKWNLAEGEEFAAGDVLCEVETDKATVDFEAQDDGFIARILADAGPNEITCGQPIMITVEDGDDVGAFKDYVVTASAAAAPEEPAAPASTPPPAPAAAAPPAPVTPPPAAAALPATAASGERVVASPLAHTLAKEMGFGSLSALNIIGTGPGGRIIADDVREYVPAAAGSVTEAAGAPVTAPGAAAVASSAAPPVPGIGFTDYPLSPAATEIAAQLSHSKQNVPHYYLTVDVALDSLLETRKQLNSTLNLGEDDAGIAVNDLLVKAAAAAMKAVPSANASWMNTAVRVYDSVDVNFVIGSGDALYSPVIRDAGRRGVKSISDEINAAVAQLEPAEEGESVMPIGEEFGAVGTVTVMNMGMYGVKACAPIIREPQAVALALGAIENRIVPNDDADSEEIYKESVMLTATLSCDHRVVDGAVGAQWLSAFKSHVENPATLLL